MTVISTGEETTAGSDQDTIFTKKFESTKSKIEAAQLSGC